MIAVMKNNNQNYLTNVLAIVNIDEDFDIQLVVFDEKYKNLLLVKLFELDESNDYVIRNAFVIDYFDQNFEQNKYIGIPDLINNSDIMENLLKNGKVPVPEIKTILDLAKMPQVLDWREISNEEDIENLLLVTGEFQDSIIEAATKEGNDLELVISIDGGLITLRFVDVAEEKLGDKLYEILDATLIIKENLFSFEINKGFGDWAGKEDADIQETVANIVAKKIFWNIKVDFEKRN